MSDQLFRCLWCKELLDGTDGRQLRRTYPLGSPCPHCGKRPLVVEPIPDEEADSDG